MTIRCEKTAVLSAEAKEGVVEATIATPVKGYFTVAL